MKTLIIGQAPGRGENGEPLAGASGRRLSALCGLSLDEYLNRFERTNLVAKYPGAGHHGDLFVSRGEAGALANDMAGIIRGRRVILLGVHVMTAFRVTAPMFFWHDHREAHMAWAPHPSGVSLWWNDGRNVSRARAFWTSEVAAV